MNLGKCLTVLIVFIIGSVYGEKLKIGGIKIMYVIHLSLFLSLTAIIGGGIGGTSCAYFLRQLLPDAELDLFEKDKIGGRLATEQIGEKKYEVGGSIIHPLNAYMVNHTRLFGGLLICSGFIICLNAVSDFSKGLEQVSIVPGVLGLHDGNDFVFLGSESSWQTILSLGWRYGGDMLTFNSLIEELMSKFTRSAHTFSSESTQGINVSF